MIQTASETKSILDRVRIQQYISDLQEGGTNCGFLELRAANLLQGNAIRTIYGVPHPLFSHLVPCQTELQELLPDTCEKTLMEKTWTQDEPEQEPQTVSTPAGAEKSRNRFWGRLLRKLKRAWLRLSAKLRTIR